ncbi:hypothetical protein COO60DRAFT_1517875, partial [Scenedesmus sp. NREL 46B-D3]
SKKNRAACGTWDDAAAVQQSGAGVHQFTGLPCACECARAAWCSAQGAVGCCLGRRRAAAVGPPAVQLLPLPASTEHVPPLCRDAAVMVLITLLLLGIHILLQGCRPPSGNWQTAVCDGLFQAGGLFAACVVVEAVVGRASVRSKDASE